ncbi:gliding motility-associated C-terminal domain-containing protein [Chitinophaga tropicalis]|uniref:T9SS type B sorting domain-containing protein n=1 Tax=Chitinophaga tropicalis TaxID=2683588 RepID=A0A7K1U1A9_9BACT|nr:gliding motility-associated C-terminal domain-containing protein [Chitinophaga tropicalis]MVT08157.1 T9SS type B sorting domain-containing protein [Chitinophaga tropicalis]
MKKILILLCVLLYGTLSMVRAQTPTAYFNVPDTVCMSTNNSTADQLKFTSINAQLNGATIVEQPTWSIKRNGTGTTADYEILYSANTTTVKDDKLKRTKSLTLQFLTPGTYDVSFTVPYYRWNGTTATYTSVTKKLVVVDCTINTCSGGNATMPGFFENFGTMASGVNRRKYPVDGVVTYTYQSSGDLNDEYYVIGSNTQFRSEWVSTGDHTGGTRGAMLIANSAYQPNLFYQKTVTGLCKGSVYNFSAWFMNVNTQGVFESNCVSDYKYSGVTFRVVNAANVNQKLAEFKTYSVSMMLGSTGPTWQRYGGSFTVPSNIDSVKVYIINDKPGGCGNDIAVDDIEFQYCSPIITASIQGNSSSLKEVLCEGAPVTINSNYVPVTYFTNPAYQWEMSDDNGVTWTNVPFGSATSKDLVIPAGQLKGTRTVQADYLFRVRIYEVGSDATTCAAPSSPIKITILPMPTLYLTKSMVCVGADVQLVASGGFDYYTWKDLPGYTGDQRTIQVVTPDTTITVYGTIEYGSGGSMYTCVDSNYAYITSLDLPTVEVAASSTNVCAGTQVELRINSTLMGNTIRWEKGPDALGNKTPIPEGNDLTSIFVQTINPADSVYTVTVTDPTGTCTAASAPFKIKITPQPVVNPGTSQVLCASANPSGDFKMNAVLQSGTTGSWSLQSVYGPGVDLSGSMTMEDYVTIANPNNPTTRVVINNPGVSAVFAWIVKSTANPNCTASGLDTLTLLYDPSYSDAGPDSTICGPGMVFTMHASAPNDTLTGPAAETGTWRLISGNATIADIHDPNTTVTSLQMVGDIVLGWSITNVRGCAANEDTVVLHKTARPTVTLAGPVISCNADGSFVIDTVATTGNPDTYSLSSVGANPLPGFTPIVEDTIIWPLTITYPAGTAPGIYNFRLSYRNKANAGCDSLTNFTVEVQTPPVAATGIAVGSPNICVTGSTTLTVVGGNLGQKANGTPNGQWVWYAGSCGGTPIGIGATITVSLTATTTYYVRAEGLGACDTTACVSTTVTVFDAPAPADAGPDQAQCMNPAFTVTGNTPTVGTGVWSLASGFGSGTATIASPNTVTTGVTVPNGDSAKLIWTITNGVCVTSDTVILRNYQQPANANAGPDQAHCNVPNFTMAATAPSIGTGKWYVISGPVTIPATDSSLTNLAVTLAAGNTATLQWVITNGVCETRDTVVLNNYVQPANAQAGPDQQHCDVAAFTLAATAPTVGTGKWYVISGPVTIGTTDSTNINAPVTLAAGNTATLQWVITNGVCETRDTVVLTNFVAPAQANAGPDQQHCNVAAFTLGATAPTAGTGKWYVISGPVTIGTTDSTNINAPITLAAGNTATLQWVITNGVCQTRDTVVLNNYVAPAQANAGPDQAQCNVPNFTMAATAPTVGTGKWYVISGPVTIPATDSSLTNLAVTLAAGNTATLQWVITNGVCETRDTVVLNNYVQPANANAGPDQAHCNVAAFTLGATAPTAGTGKWYVISGPVTIGTTDSTNINAPITLAAGNTATLQWVITNGVCVTRDTVVLTNYVAPAQANAGPDQAQCNVPNFTMAAAAPTVGTGKWYVISGPVTIPATDSSLTNLAVTLAAGNTATLQWVITNGVCETRDTVVLNNYVQPANAQAGPDQQHCDVAAFTLAATAPTVGTGKWYVISGPVTIGTTDSTNINAPVTLAAGNTATLQWVITNGVCETRDTVVLTNFVAPAQANAGPDQAHCNVAAFTLGATAPTAGTGKWYVISGPVTIGTTDSTNINAPITLAAGNTATLQWVITNGVCQTRDTVVLNNYVAPAQANAGPDQAQCNVPNFTMAATAPTVGTGKWYVISGPVTIPATDSSLTNLAVTLAAGNTATLQWVITNGVCETRDTVVLNNYVQPANANAGPDQAHCNVAAFTLGATAPTAGTGKWYVISGPVTIGTTDSTNINAPITLAAGNTATLQWVITNGVCVTRDTVVLNNYVAPAQANAGPDQAQCNVPNFTMAAAAPTVGTGKWYVISGPVTIPATDSSLTNLAVTLAAGNTATLQWVITNGVCETRDTVVLNNYVQPANAQAGPDQQHCDVAAFTLAATAPTVGTGKWYVISGPVTIGTTDSTNINAPVTLAAGNTATLQWVITNGVCETRDTVVLTNFVAPAKANAGPDQEHCNVPNFTLSATAPTAGTGKWYVISGPVTIGTTDSTNINAPITLAAGNTAILQWVITNGVCETRDTVVLSNYVAPAQANAGPDQAQCDNQNFTLAATAPTVGTGKWYVISGPVTIGTTDSTNINAPITLTAGNTATLQWVITNGVCETRDTVVLNNYIQPAKANAGPDQEHCNVANFTLAATVPTVGTGKWYVISGPVTIGTTDSTNINAPITLAAGNTATLQWVITNGVCETRDTVVLTNFAQPTAADAGPDQSQCNVANFTMNGSTPSVGAGKWTVAFGTATIAATDSTLSNAPVTVAAGDTAVLVWTITNGQCSTNDTVILRNYQQPLTANAGPDQEMCLNTAGFTMAAVAPTERGAIGTWTVVSGPATIPAGQEHNPNVNIVLPNDATAILRWTVTNGNCPPVSDDVQITNYLTPADANAGPDQDHCNDANFTMAGSTPDVTGAVGTWTVVMGNGTIAASDVNLPNAAVTVPQGDTAMLVWTIANPTCTSKPDTVILRNFQAPAPAAAGADQEHCNDANFTMAANVPSVGTGKWNVISGTATIAPADINNPAAVVVVPVGNTATLEWQITNGVCDTRDQVVLTNYQPPAKATAGPDQDHCDDANFTVAGNTPTVGTGTWSILNGTGTIDPTTINTPTALVGVNAGDTVSLVWTITNGVCVEKDTVILRNYIAPAASNAGADQEHCNDANFTMNGSTPSVGTGKWTLVTGKATIASTDSTLSNAPVIVAAGDTAILAWTITNGVCQTTDMVTLRNFMQPTQANAGADVEHCNDANFTMNGSTPSVGAGLWTVHSGTATIAASTATLPNATVTVAPGDTAVLYWTITNGLCTTVDSVILRNYMLPSTAAAGPDQDHCMDPNFTLAANTPAVGTGRWTVIQGAAVIANVASPTSTVTVPNGDSATLVWTISNGTCTATTDTVKLRNYLMPANANAGADQTNCDNVNFTMNATPVSPAYAIGTWTIISGSPTITDIHNPSTTVQVPAGTSATLQWTITNGICTSTPDQVTLTNQPAILGNTITADQLLCANETPAMLQGGTVSGGNGTFTYQWQVSTTSATTGFVNVATGGTNATYSPANITQNTWYRRVVMSGACTGNISNAVMLTLMNTPPVVISVPPAVTTDCVQGKDYTTLFGTPVFSHAPYTNEPLTVTYNDVTTVVNACTTTIMRTWTATDRCGLTTQAQQTITVVDRTAPVFSSAAPASVTVECNNVPAAVNLTAIDACNGTMTITPIEVRVDQPGACASNYQLIRKWVAVDACGNASDTLRQTITVRDMTAPVFDNPAPANITVDCDKVPAGAPLTATDNCTPGVITVNPVDTRKNISNSACADNYQIIRTWTATDLCGNKTVLTQTITVQDTIRPVFSMTVPSSLTVDCDKVPTVPAITATDNCTATIAVKVSEKKEFLSTTCLSSYRLTRTWTATDNCGNKNTMQQVILVQDTTRPTFTVVPPADTTVSCDAIPDAPANISATDNCGSVKISYTQSRESITGACASNYRLIRTWTAKDNCSNTAVVRQVITVVDTTRPVIDPAPADVTLTCGQSIPVAATLYAKDNCDGTFPKKVTMTTDPYTVDVCAGYTIIRRWNITDACGNAAFERVQTITVSPCPKPQLDPNMAANCSNNTKFALMLLNKVSKPKFTLVGIVPAGTVSTPLTQTSNVFDLKGATQATFTVTDGVTGCVSDPVTYNLQYIPKPVVNLGNDTAICVGDNITLDAGAANAAYTIRWSTGATTQTITVNAAGTYYATVSNGICSTTDSIKVSVNNPPVVNLRDTAICEGQSVKLNAYVQGASYVWSTGETTASITVNMSGTYGVDVTLKGCTTHKDVTVTVNPAPQITLTDDITICPDATTMLTVNPDGGTVRWSTGETSSSIVVSKAGNYVVTVSRGGCVIKDSVEVSLRPDLTIDLGPDREFCTGGRVTVDATHPDAVSYMWNDGYTTPQREITQPGKYIVSVMDRFCSRITMDSINVTVAGIPGTILPNDTIICIGQTLTLKPNVGTANSIRWQDGSTNSTYVVSTAGTYTVTVSNECGTATDDITVGYKQCEAKPQFPNAFTPNNDGHNDNFKPIVDGPMYDYDLRIYNRWGELIFLSKDAQKGWDGKYKGKLVEVGTYVWMLTYKKVLGGAVNVVKGEVTAIR